MTRRNIPRVRNRLLANGYSPMPGKDGRPNDWYSVVVTESIIRGWDDDKRLSRATGIRIEDDLVKLSVVVNEINRHVELCDELMELEPKLRASPLTYGNGDTNTTTFLVRTDEPFGRINTSYWLQTTDEGPELDYVEALGSLGGSQVDGYGRRRGEAYDLDIYWEPNQPTPLGVRREELPLLSRNRLQSLIDISAARLRRSGGMAFTDGPGPDEEFAGIDLVFDETF